MRSSTICGTSWRRRSGRSSSPGQPASQSPPGPLACADGCVRCSRQRRCASSRSAPSRRHGHRREPNPHLRELMATIGHSCPVAALRHRHTTAGRSREIADYLDGVIGAARPPNRSPQFRNRSSGPSHGCGMERTRPKRSSRKESPRQDNKKRRRAESNRRTGLCRPLPKPLGHAAVRSTTSTRRRTARRRTNGRPA